MIEIHLLEQLAAFEEAGTLSKAAERLSISQPALSRSMQKLEDEMEVPLFERYKNKISLNDNGRLTADYARQVLHTEKEMIERVHALERNSHTITFGSIAPGPNTYYQPILAQLYPNMSVLTELKDEDTLLSGLEDETYQFIFLTHEISAKELFCTQAASEQLYLSVFPAHPASSFKEISFKDVDGESFLMYTHIGFWDNVVRKNMPNSRFLLQNEFEDFGEIVRNTSLPCFGSDLVAHSTASHIAGRINIPFTDKDASAIFYFICKLSNKKKYREFIARLPD